MIYKQSWLLKYSVDPCEEDSNLDITTRHTMYIYVKQMKIWAQQKTYKYGSMLWIIQILHCNLGKEMNAQQKPRVFVSFSTNYDSIHANKFLEVEHGINHLITSQWWKSLTSAMEIIINANDSQVPKYIPLNVNRCSDVEHSSENFDQT